MKVSSKVELITPTIAVEYLKKNKLNRPLRLKWVTELSNQMKDNGAWHLSGEPLIFGESGDLLDGQHRLQAIIDSGTEHSFLVVRGIEDKAFTTIDTGKRRSYTDALYIAGFAQPALYGRLGGMCLNWNRGIFFGGMSSVNKPTNDEVVDFVKRHKPDCAETVNYILKLKSRKLVHQKVLLFAYHKMKELHGDDAFFFIEKLVSGKFSHDSDRDQPIRVLRERLIDNQRSEAKLPVRSLFILVFAAWNAFRKGEKITSLNIPQELKNNRVRGRLTLY